MQDITYQQDIINEAHNLYGAGLNVFPIPFAGKKPFGSHALLATTRVHLSFLDDLFANSNIAVMTGRLSGNLFVLDCDDDATFEYVGEQLRQRHIHAWIRLGVRGGQFWLRCAEGEVQNASLGALQVLGNRTYTVAPPSLHPEGVFYEWRDKDGELPPPVSIRQLDFLKLALESENKGGYKRDKTTLPPAAYRVLVEGNTSGYKSNSEAEFAACLSLIQAGIPDMIIRTIFAQFNPPHYAKRRGKSFEQYTLLPAHDWLKKSDAKSVQQAQTPHSALFVAYTGARTWMGRTGNTDRAVYLGLCERMRMDKGARVFRASVRELSELANVGTQAVQTALKRLRDSGMVKYESKDGTTGACLYSLVVQDEMAAITTVGKAYTPVSGSVVTADMITLQNDAFHTRALGKTALLIWNALLSAAKPMTLKELVTTIGKVRATIQHNLTKLENHGLARRMDAAVPAEWKGISATPQQLEMIAVTMGTQGKAAKRKAVHAEERQKRVSAMLLKQKARYKPKPSREC